MEGLTWLGTYEALRGILHLLIPVLALFAAWRSRVGRRWQGLAALGAFALICMIVYQIWVGRKYDHRLNGYDVYHYYLSTRYREELGTELLYACTMVADSELPKPRFDRPMAVRDLSTYEMKGRPEALEKGAVCPERFGERRWARFKKDIAFFQKILDKSEWDDIFVDRGANASPVWQLTGGTISRLVPVESLLWAAQIDLVLLLGATLLVGWAFGAEAALILVAFLFTSFSTRWPPLGGALLRYDWLACSLAALSLWKKERPALGGAALAYATGARIFPIFLFGGLAARAGWCLLRERRFPRPELRFAGGFGATLALLCGLAALNSGPGSFGEFKEKMAIHSAAENISVMRVGLPVAALYRGELPETNVEASGILKQKRVLGAELDPWIKGLSVLAGLVVLGVAGTRGLNDQGALLLGVALVPLGLQISYYYYIFLAFPALIHTWGLPRRGPLLGLLAVTGLGACAIFATAGGVTRWTVLNVGSILVCVYAVGLILGASRMRESA